MKKILVTGGAGFLGSHLCKKLLQKGHDVLCVDNLFTGQKSNIAQLLKYTNFQFVRHDITFPLYVEVDEIYNLACPASPIQYQKKPVQTIKTAVLGTINMLGLSKRTNARFLQASTSEIYGDPLMHPQKEEYWGNVNPIGIRSCYDEGKRCGETITMDYSRQYNLDVRIARIFNTYGPKMDRNDGRVISNFIVQALQNKPLSIYGDGMQTRSFCYVDDLINGLIKLMEINKIDIPINIGNPNEINVLETAEKIISLTKSSSTISFIPKLADDPQKRNPNIDKAISFLGWRPVIPIDKGLIKTIAYFKKILDNAR